MKTGVTLLMGYEYEYEYMMHALTTSNFRTLQSILHESTTSTVLDRGGRLSADYGEYSYEGFLRGDVRYSTCISLMYIIYVQYI